MNRRRLMMKSKGDELPYTPLRRIESQNRNAANGTYTIRQGTFIKTGVFPRSDCRLVMKFKTNATQVAWTSFFGMMFHKGGKKVRTHLIYETSISKTELAYMDAFSMSGTTSITVPKNMDIVLTYDNGVFSVNDTVYTAPNITTPIDSSNELVLLDHYLYKADGNVNYLTALVLLESVEMWDVNGARLLDYEPCKLKETNEVGMWDLVSDTFFGASNNPSQPPLQFIAGDEIIY